MKKVYFDSERCLGCHSCEFACAVEHTLSKSAAAAVMAGERTLPRRRVMPVGGASLTVGCRHCDPAGCVEACMAGAMTKDPDTGEVRCDTDQCVGCWMCVMVCPFGAARTGEVYTIKCDMCIERDGGPVCVEACPTKALFEATAEEFAEYLQARAAERKAEVVP